MKGATAAVAIAPLISGASPAGTARRAHGGPQAALPFFFCPRPIFLASSERALA